MELLRGMDRRGVSRRRHVSGPHLQSTPRAARNRRKRASFDRFCSRLFTQRAFATATTGQLTALTFDDGKIGWLEGTTGAKALTQHIFQKGPKREALTSVCSVAAADI